MKKFTYFLPTLILFYFFSFPIFAQNKEIRFKHITINDGLSQSTVSCIFQDRKGFIWFGTEEGLNRYDGNDIDQIQPIPGNPNSLSNNYIRALYEDENGIIWIGTQGGGVDKYDPEYNKFSHYVAGPDPDRNLSSNIINAICGGNQGELWIGTDDGLIQFDLLSEQMVCYRNDPNNPGSLSDNRITTLYHDSSGVLWAGSENGLNRFKRQDNNFFVYKKILGNEHSITDNRITAFFEDQQGNIWVGTQDGLSKFDRQNNSFEHYHQNSADPDSISNDHIYSILEDKFGSLWIGTINGLNLFDQESGNFFTFFSDPFDPESLLNNEIHSMCEDKTGVFWIGTHKGISRFDQEKKQFRNIRSKPGNPNSLSFNYVYSLYEDRSGLLWIGTYGGGLNKFSPEKNQYVHYRTDQTNPDSLSNDYVRAIFEDSRGYLWIGTAGGGLNKFDRDQDKFIRFKSTPDDPNSLSDNNARWIYEDSTGILWIATSNGLNRMDGEKNRFIRYLHKTDDPGSISNNFIYNIFEDSKGTLWIATLNGLNIYDREKDKFILKYFADQDEPQSLSSSEILYLYEDRSGILWAGTGLGLNKFDRANNSFSHYSVKDGLPNNIIYAIGEDEKGYLWMSTNRGLSRFNPVLKEFKNYDVKDGLQSSEFNMGALLIRQDGEMYFGGINGITAFYPEKISDNPYVPFMVITDVLLLNKSIPVGEKFNNRVILEKSIPYTNEVNLYYSDRFIKIEFAALHYASPEYNQYKYQLEGLQKDWFQVGSQPFATFTNLPPKEYIFRVKGTNNDGLWNAQEAWIKIIIIPPFWKTLWFRVLITLSSLTALLLIFRSRTHAIKERNIELEERVNERTSKLQLEIQERKRFEQEAKLLATRTSLIYESGKRLSSELDLDELLRSIVKVIHESFNYYGVIMRILEEKSGHLIFKSAAGPGFENIQKNLDMAPGEGMTGQAALSGKTQISGDVSKNPHYYRQESQKTKSELSIPIKSGKKVIGVLDIQSRKYNAFDKNDVTAMETLSSQIANAIENARLYEQAQNEISERKKAESSLLEREKQLESSLEEKEVLLKEIHHRVKNNMQIISSLLRLQSGMIKDLKALELFRESQNRIQSMALIHGTLYQSDDLAKIDFYDYMRNLTSNLMIMFKKDSDRIKFKMDISDVFLDINQGIPCGLIINEIITNSLKHAFPKEKKGTIEIKMTQKSNDKFSLIVSDNGIGIPEEIDFNSTATLGMQLISELAGQLNGKIFLDRSSGSKYTIEF